MSIVLGRGPRTDSELYELVKALWGHTIPRHKVCPEHNAPFEAFAHGYFNRAPQILIKGSRGLSGKSRLVSLLGLTYAAVHGADTNIVGGSLNQSVNIQETIRDAFNFERAPRYLIRDESQTAVRLVNGAVIRPLTASQKTVRGPHPPMLLLDEIDEMDVEILESAKGQPMPQKNYRGEIIPAQTIMRVVAKSGDGEQEQVEFAQAVSALEEICKAGVVSKVKTPYDYGFVFREDLIRRDPGSGQFQTKIKRTQVRPINDKTAASMGIPEHTTENKPTKFTPKQKAQYQDEYRQLAHFLGSVAQSTQNSGDTRIDLHFEDDQGNQWIEEATSTRPKPGLLDPRDRNLRGVTAYPKTLNLGGAAFGLSGALGGGLSPQRVGQINTAAAQMPSFAQAWTRDYGHTDTNARLYGRTKAGGQLLTEVAPAGSKANLAGHFGRFVGQYGPQAEAVIGPPARKTAYRYRGTEKKPDEKMVEAYRQEVNRQMAFRSGFGDEETQTAVKTAQTRALKAEQNKIADREGKPVEAVRIPEDRRRQILDATKAKVRSVQRPGKPTWTEQNAASAAIIDHLQRPTSEGGAAPEKKLYNLQLASGNVPPSEGVILDRDGQIVTQAIGYGDDHYLPFNLKNLKALKGGSYIRNRSVGGLTSEDIYTGLVSGARQVTVVSRSGVFTMKV